MSISIKLMSKKLGFLSPSQPVMFSRKYVLLLHRRCLTSQIQSSYLDKLIDVPCLPVASLKTVYSEDNNTRRQHECICFSQHLAAAPSDSPQQSLLSGALKQCTHTCDLIATSNYDLDKSVRLSAKPCHLTSSDIILRNNYVTYKTNSPEDFLFKFKHSSASSDKAKPNNNDISRRPSDEHLLYVREVLAKTLPNLFVSTIDYGIYHRDIVFVNNIRGTTTQGIGAYIRQVSLLRALGHFKFAYVRFEILKITSHPEDSTIRMRWRIRGIRGYMIVWNLFRHRVWRTSELIQNYQDLWYDGFSTYHVGGNGQVYKHVADKVMPDDNPVVARPKQTPLAPKLAALFVGLVVSSKDAILSSSKSVMES